MPGVAGASRVPSAAISCPMSHQGPARRVVIMSPTFQRRLPFDSISPHSAHRRASGGSAWIAVCVVCCAGAGPATVLWAVPDAGSLSSVGSRWFANEAIDGRVPSNGDGFATAVATGDFNGDGAADLATGMPQDDGPEESPVGNAGAVIVRWGVPGQGLGSATTLLSLFASGGAASAHSSDFYGSALAAGDFDGDGRDDLAVGVPSPGDFTDGSFVVIHRGLPGGIELAAQQLFRPGEGGVPVVPGDYDVFGAALAVGDFNADSYDDLAIGAPQNNLNDGCGGVVVLHGGPTGLSTADAFLIHQSDPQLPDACEQPDHFGAALTAGNFNGDRWCFMNHCFEPYDDLAISAPGEDGEGSPNSLLFASALYLGQGDLGGTGGESGDQFGWALASGDTNWDGFAELAIGAPYEDLGATNQFADAGEVTVLFGAASGFDYGQTVRRSKDSLLAAGPLGDSRFGFSLAMADFDRDGKRDLAVGIPGDTVRGSGAGAAVVFLSEANRSFSRYRLQYPGGNGIPPGEQTGAQFATTLAAGDFDADGHADLVLGAPFRDLAGVSDSGVETVLYGTLCSDGFASGDLTFWSASAP